MYRMNEDHVQHVSTSVHECQLFACLLSLACSGHDTTSACVAKETNPMKAISLRHVGRMPLLSYQRTVFVSSTKFAHTSASQL